MYIYIYLCKYISIYIYVVVRPIFAVCGYFRTNRIDAELKPLNLAVIFDLASRSNPIGERHAVQSHVLIRGARGGGGRGSPKRLYKAPTDYTKPQNNIQRHKETIQRHNILDKDPTYLARVATNIHSTYNIKYQILITYINLNILALIKGY